MKRLLAISLIVLFAVACRTTPLGNARSVSTSDSLSELTRQVTHLSTEVAMLRAELKAHYFGDSAAQNVLAHLGRIRADLRLEYLSLTHLYPEGSDRLTMKEREILEVESLIAEHRSDGIER